MTPEELYLEYQHLPEVTAKRMLINVDNVARKNSIEAEDIYQYGREALWLACNDYDSSKGRTFKNFAISRIRWKISQSIKRDCKLLSFKSNNWTRVSKKDIIGKLKFISLDDQIDSSDGESHQYHELITTDEITPEIEVVSENEYKCLLNILTEEEYKIVTMRMKSKTFDEIAKAIGTTRQTTQNRYNNIRDKIKQYQSTGTVTCKLHKPKNSIKVCVDGKVYDSIMEVSRVFGIDRTSVRNRLKSKSDKFKNWYYIDENKNDNKEAVAI